MSGWISPGGPACRLAASHLQGPTRLTTHELDHLPSLVAPNVSVLAAQRVHPGVKRATSPACESLTCDLALGGATDAAQDGAGRS